MSAITNFEEQKKADCGADAIEDIGINLINLLTKRPNAKGWIFSIVSQKLNLETVVIFQLSKYL